MSKAKKIDVLKFSDNKKIIIVVTCVFVFASVSLYSFNLWYHENFEPQSYHKFFSKNFDPDKERIILIGTSHTARLKADYMEKQFLDNGIEFEVINLSSSNFNAERVLPQVDGILSMKPDQVLHESHH